MEVRPDPFFLYGKSIEIEVRPRTVLVEGSSDADLFLLASRLEYQNSGIDLLGDDLAIAAAGAKDRGGVMGVARELITMRGLAKVCLDRAGRPLYRVACLVDNDNAGRKMLHDVKRMDPSLLEYRDIFRLHPAMPASTNLDPDAMCALFVKANVECKSLDWELEDLMPKDFVDAFAVECPGSIRLERAAGGYIHREFTHDGKMKFHRFIKQHAVLNDVRNVIDVLKAVNSYLGIRKREKEGRII